MYLYTHIISIFIYLHLHTCIHLNTCIRARVYSTCKYLHMDCMYISMYDGMFLCQNCIVRGCVCVARIYLTQHFADNKRELPSNAACWMLYSNSERCVLVLLTFLGNGL